MKKILALLLAITMIAAFCACAQKPADTTPADTSADTASDAPAASDGKLIKVGIINNDPNESGYRTANDKDLKVMRSERARSAREKLCLSAEIFRFFPWAPFQLDSNPL